jgi:uncharacterized protein YciI
VPPRNLCVFRARDGAMSQRFAYFYFMVDDPTRVRAVAPAHSEHWRRLQLDGYSGGPFADRSGGLITFETDDRERAESAVAGDPFVREGLLASYWLKPWQPKPSSQPSR